MSGKHRTTLLPNAARDVNRQGSAEFSRNGDGHDETVDPSSVIRAPADVAGICDLKRAGASLEWVWEGWMQRRAVTLVGAEGGTGKTRFAADLVRRIRHGLPWPDGPVKAGYEGETVALWVVADNHHGEMVTLCESFGISDCVKVNAAPAEPYGGVSLEALEDWRLLDRRVEVVKPLLVIVDTVGNATDRNLSKQEDAKAFYWPLQVLARKRNVAVLALTHLNASGTVLGRRGVEKVRTVIRMTAQNLADVNCKRRLEVTKSNGKYPAALGMTMGDTGNTYDTDAPPPPVVPGFGSSGAAGAKSDDSGVLGRCSDWLAAELLSGPRRVSELRSEGEAKGYAAGTLYRARAGLELVQFKRGTAQFWGFLEESDELKEE